MKVGLVGFSGSGKSTVFRWLTGVTPDPARIQQGQMGTADVFDERLALMSAKFNPKKTKYAHIDFLDTPGLLMDEREDNPRRLGILREANGMIVVLDGFNATNYVDQLKRFQSELIFADLEIVSNRVSKLNTAIKKPRPAKEREIELAELALLQRVVAVLEEEKPVLTLGLKPDEEKLIRSFQLLTLKPEMVLVNRGDNEPNSPLPADLLAVASNAVHAPVKLELELAELDEESKTAFMADLGITAMKRNEVIHAMFDSMGMQVFFTVGEDECRSWPIEKGMDAVTSAGEIHTDLSRRFVRSEVVGYDDFRACGYSEKEAKAKGVYRLEGKTYIVKDGDIMHILASS